MKDIRILTRLGRFFLVAALLSVAFTCSVAAQDAEDCSAEKALKVARADYFLVSYCKHYVTPRHYECSFDVKRTSPIIEKSDPNIAWYVTASSPELTFLAGVSKSCQMIPERPILLKHIELGTIELGVFESKDIVIGKVVDVKSPDPVFTHGGVKIQTETVTVEVSKVLKGEQTPKVIFDQHFTTAETSAKRWIDNGHEMLFFISRGGLFNSPDNPGCLFLADQAGKDEHQKLAALQSCQNCIGLSEKTGPDETQQREVLKECVSKIPLDNKIIFESLLSAIFKKPTVFQKPVLLGNWPNGIDLETGKNDSIYPIFSKSGDILKMQQDILNAVQAEIAAEAGKPDGNVTSARTSSGQLGKETELSPEKYPQAYDTGIPKNRLVILDIPPQ